MLTYAGKSGQKLLEGIDKKKHAGGYVRKRFFRINK